MTKIFVALIAAATSLRLCAAAGGTLRENDPLPVGVIFERIDATSLPPNNHLDLHLGDWSLGCELTNGEDGKFRNPRVEDCLQVLDKFAQAAPGGDWYTMPARSCLSTTVETCLSSMCNWSFQPQVVYRNLVINNPLIEKCIRGEEKEGMSMSGDITLGLYNSRIQ